MSLVINAPAIESRLQFEASKRGVNATDYAIEILAAHLPPVGDSEGGEKSPFYATATPEEWVRIFDAWIEEHPTREALPEDAFDRASFYEAHR